ncbi:S8 family serine peptidase [Thalassotalea sp. M1531]|uniref:S8 family serine peptidase n=1 Tax=Thalassotalea algicola TaxID=2716224 RepID=A0A7Y0LFG1_9GAMM|nr:S8 family serine peptidase [Thalassotalea algicola]NMP33177.1 S8 family serine peptidase [Thalassotalea algicola]
MNFSNKTCRIKNVFVKLFFISFLLLSFTSNGSESLIALDYHLQSKFEFNISQLAKEPANYIVYFGDSVLSDKSISNNKRVGYTKFEHKLQQKLVAKYKANILNAMPTNDYQLVRSFKSIPAIVIKTSPATIKQIARLPWVNNVGLDSGMGKAHLNHAIPQANLDLVKALPLDGSGIEVAIIDSGLDQDHPDFAGRVLSQTCFSDDCHISTYDQNGHGTNVAGILAGNGTVAPQGGAPEAKLHILKILDADGNYSAASQAVSALDYIISDLPNVSIVNMSFGTDRLFSSVCDDETSWSRSLASAVNQLHARGVTLFASSGNEGSITAITAPACLANVIAVGAVWDTGISSYNGFCFDSSPVAGELTCFSNSNTSIDIVAPGALTKAAGINQGVSTFAGTSMATPLVASCATLLKQRDSTLSPEQIRSYLKENSGQPVTDRQGRTFPSLDCWQAFQALPYDETPSITRLAPTEVTITTENPEIAFSANAIDTEDGDITDNIRWQLDGVEVSTFGSNFNHTFSLGEHVVTAVATDSAYNMIQLDWHVKIVTDANLPPEINITSPDNNSEYTANQTINFTAQATDQIDGDISHNIQWLYNEETIAQGESFSRIFNEGSHTVIAQVQNSLELTSQTEISFTVTASQPPTVTPDSNSGGSGGTFAISLIFILLLSLIRLFKT